MMIVQPGRFANPSCALDPYAANRVFFLRGQGANGSKPTTDETGKALTWNGGAQISTASSKWAGYGSSISPPSFPGDSVQTPSHADFDFGSGDFTIRWYMSAASASGTNLDFFNRAGLSDYALRIVLAGGNVAAYASSTGTSWNLISGGLQIPIVTGAFGLYEIGRNGSNWYGFRDGALVASTTASGGIVAVSSPVTMMNAGNSAYYNDFQVYKGVCLHTSAYTPATLPPC